MSNQEDVLRRIRERKQARMRGELTGMSLSVSVLPQLSPRRSELDEEAVAMLPPAPSPPVTTKHQQAAGRTSGKDELPTEIAPPSPPSRRAPALRTNLRTGPAERAAKTGSAPAASSPLSLRVMPEEVRSADMSPQSVWRKSPGSMDRMQAVRIADLGAQRRKAEEERKEPEQRRADEDDEEGADETSARRRGMTAELDGFMGNLGLKTMSKPPPTATESLAPPRELSPRTASGTYRPVAPSTASNDALLLDLAGKINSMVIERNVSKAPLDRSARPPTIQELERDVDYASMDVLPPLPDVAPITNKQAYKGYMKLKYAWSERRTKQQQQQPQQTREEEAVDNQAEDLVDDIFDASMELRTVDSGELDVSRFSVEYEYE